MTRETAIETAQPQPVPEGAVEAALEAAETVTAPEIRQRIGRLAVADRYQPIRQPETAAPLDTSSERKETRAASRFGGQTLLDTISRQIQTSRRVSRKALRSRTT